MFERKNCSGCGAKNVAQHELKISKGLYGHPYDGPTVGKHRRIERKRR
jgi:hypothetical protein